MVRREESRRVNKYLGEWKNPGSLDSATFITFLADRKVLVPHKGKQVILEWSSGAGFILVMASWQSGVIEAAEAQDQEFVLLTGSQ